MSAPQLVRGAQIDYLVFDYLAEVTMSILASQRLKDPSAGYATDFVHITMKSLLPDLVARKVRVVANAGGVNPLACRDGESIRWPAVTLWPRWRRRSVCP